MQAGAVLHVALALTVCVFFLFPFQAKTVNMNKATFGAGCFWGVEKWFLKQFPKLKSSAVGYLGGTVANPSYEAVCTGKTGHAEVLQVEFDDSIKYEDLVMFFFSMHDPTTLNRQGNDRGTQYRSAIFFHSPDQEAIAKRVRDQIQASEHMKHYQEKEIRTEILPASEFYKAEAYHQGYLAANPGGYCNHRPMWKV